MNQDCVPTSYEPFGEEALDYAPFEQLRRDCPIAWSRSGWWLVSRHEDITAIALDICAADVAPSIRKSGKHKIVTFR
jgi:hypothetical protein